MRRVLVVTVVLLGALPSFWISVYACGDKFMMVGRGVRFRALGARGPVLDLSRRADMIDLARRLETASPRP